MCWEIDYKLFAELEKARETKVKQEQRAVVIDNLLNEANKQSDKTNVDGTTVEEVSACKVDWRPLLDFAQPAARRSRSGDERDGS